MRRVERGGLFKGMTKQSLLERAQDTSLLSLQNGTNDFLQNFCGKWGILSVGWSATFIKTALRSRGVQLDDTNTPIVANEVEFDEHDIGTGNLSKHEANTEGIRIANDKLREMRKMLASWRRDYPSRTDEQEVVVYVGDSETDLLCLLEADVGVIMNSQGMVDKCEKMGLEVKTGLDDLPARRERKGDSPPNLRRVDDFRAFLNA